MPTRVLILVTVDRFFMSHRLRFARALKAAGAEVLVASAAGVDTDRIRAEGFTHIPISFNRKSINPFRELGVVLQITRAYRRYKPDLVHHVAVKPVVYGSLAAQLARVPAVVNLVTGLGYTFASRDLKARLIRLASTVLFRIAFMNSKSRVIFQNPDDRKLFVDAGIVPEDRTRVILGSGVDTERFSSQSQEPNDVPRVLLAARMIWSKGVGEAVEAFRTLAKRGVQCKLILAGGVDSDSPTPISREQLVRWTEEGVAEWVGFQSDMPSLLNQVDIVLLPSTYREGVPLALIEAASCGKPIITLDAPGCREIVSDRENGVLLADNRPETIADALETLINDRELRLSMGRRGREKVLKQYSNEVVFRETMAVYKDLYPRAFV